MIPDSFIGGSCRWLVKMINSRDPIPAGACRHCGAVIGLNNFICPCCSCSYPFSDLTNMDQMEEVTRSQRVLWQEVPENTFGFGHPHKIPPDNRMLQVKYLTKMRNDYLSASLAAPSTVDGHGEVIQRCSSST